MLRRWLPLVLVLLTAAAVDSVDEHRRAGDRAPASGAPAGASSLRVVMDPASGEIVARPTADDLGRLAAAPRADRRRSGELESFDLPSGARGVALDGWAHHQLRLARDSTGALRVVCSRGDRHAEAR